MTIHRTLLAVTTLLLALTAPAHADGLADLKAALARASAPSNVKASIDLATVRRIGDAQSPEHGQVTVTVEDGASGLKLAYSRDTVARIDTEQRARSRDPDAKTPTLSALRSFDTVDLMPMVASAPALARMLERAAYKGERSDSYSGKPARLLSFEMPLSSLSKRERVYAKRIESLVEVWTAEDGTPLASRMTQTVFGRAFVVVSFESKLTEESVFGMSANRLVTLRRVTRSSTAGAGEKEERSTTKTLQIL